MAAPQAWTLSNSPPTFLRSSRDAPTFSAFALRCDSLDAVRSRRDYTYLPNGQLGTIAGKTAGNVAWTVTMRYDERGRPLTIVYSGGDSIELFWDESDRLIDTAITHASPISGVTIVRWHYHYVGGTLLAASRELSTPPVAPATKPTIAVKRFWVITDERGLPHRVLDEQGAEYWKATWDASGWRTMQTQAAEMNWMPFGLPGQLVLRDTEAYASGTEGGTTVTRFRAPLILNQWRAYDALTGTYLQPDGADVLGRSDPEGYAYARSSPVNTVDLSGAKSVRKKGSIGQSTSFPGCTDSQNTALTNAISSALKKLATCKDGFCGFDGGASLRRNWLNSLAGLQMECVSPLFGEASFDKTRMGALDGTLVVNPGRIWKSGQIPAPVLAFTSIGLAKPRTAWGYAAFLSTARFCLAALVAHEALHPVFRTFYADDLLLNKPHQLLQDFFGPPAYTEQEREGMIENAPTDCKLCEK